MTETWNSVFAECYRHPEISCREKNSWFNALFFIGIRSVSRKLCLIENLPNSSRFWPISWKKWNQKGQESRDLVFSAMKQWIGFISKAAWNSQYVFSFCFEFWSHPCAKKTKIEKINYFPVKPSNYFVQKISM